MGKYEYFFYKRKQRNISLKDISTKLNFSIGYISLIENGKRKLTYELAVELAAFLDRKPDELFYNDYVRNKKKENK